MRELWYNGKYKTFTGISPSLFAMASLLIENEKKEFQEMVDVVPIKDDIKEKIERIVTDMNFDDELIEKYYDLDLEREKMLKATYEEIYEELYKKSYEKLKKETEEKARQQVQNQVQKEVQKEKEKTILTMFNNGLTIDLIANYTATNKKEIEKIIKENK